MLAVPAVAYFGCAQIIGTDDDLVFDLTTSGSGGNAASNSVSTGTGGSPMLPDAPHLILHDDSSADRQGVELESAFRLNFSADTGWQIDQWYDLASDPGLQQDLASTLPANGKQQTSVLFNGLLFLADASWHQVDTAQSSGVTVIDERPARIIMQTTMEYSPMKYGIQVDVDYTLYASGRVALHTVATNTTDTSQTLENALFNYTSLNTELKWEPVAAGSSRAAGFFVSNVPDPAPRLLAISHGSETASAKDADSNIHWVAGTINLLPSAQFTRDAELQVALSEVAPSAFAARANDILNPATIAMQGDGVASAYDTKQGAYPIDAQGSSEPLSWLVNSTLDRFQPAFVISDYQAPQWTLRLGDEVLAKSDDLSGPNAHVFHDAAKGRLVIVYLGTLPSTSAAAQRTFSLSPTN